jgi:hypothetical protein
VSACKFVEDAGDAVTILLAANLVWWRIYFARNGSPQWGALMLDGGTALVLLA